MAMPKRLAETATEQSRSGTPIEIEQALLNMAHAIIACHTLPELATAVAQSIAALTSARYFAIQFYDRDNETMVSHVSEISGGFRATRRRQLPLGNTVAGQVFQEQKSRIIKDFQGNTDFPLISKIVLGEYGCRSAAFFPLTTTRQRIGVMTFMARPPDAFAAEEFELLRRVADQVAVAVENILHHDEAARLRREVERQRDWLRVLLEITNVTVTHHDLGDMFLAFSLRLKQTLGYEYSELAIADRQGEGLLVVGADFGARSDLISRGMRLSPQSVAARTVVTGKVHIFDRAELQTLGSPLINTLLDELGIQCACGVPLIYDGKSLGAVVVACDKPRTFIEETLELLIGAVGQLTIAVKNALEFKQIDELKNRLAREKLYLQDEAREEYDHDEIVGKSKAIRDVLAQVKMVAATDATVLICGETGTGKEMIARALHHYSGRKSHVFVKMNCAAIPAALLESELFGHEKGAYTGATSQRIGRFELANDGTLFLDEIGDMPLELQPKLLRVLQEREFERLGGHQIVRTNARVLAATNRDLHELAAAGEFRSDLFYRLDVFPIQLPPLRERREDVPLLVETFAHRYAKRLNKRIEIIPDDRMQALVEYDWPGNLRELQNFIERAVILSRGPVLELPVQNLRRTRLHRESPPTLSVAARTTSIPQQMDAVQRQHIIDVLRESRWIIGGPHGAAARLGMKRTTLISRMQKLGIKRPA